MLSAAPALTLAATALRFAAVGLVGWRHWRIENLMVVMAAIVALGMRKATLDGVAGVS